MTTLYLASAAVGLVLLLAQLVLGAIGADHAPDAGDAGATPLGEGLALLSVRSVSAAAAAFGLAGLGAGRLGLPAAVALPAAGALALAAAWVMARVQRAMTTLERDHVLDPVLAIGHVGTVHLLVPAAAAGLGKVTLELQGHFVELPARTRGDDALPGGTAVLVTDASPDGVLEVAAADSLLPETAA